MTNPRWGESVFVCLSLPPLFWPGIPLHKKLYFTSRKHIMINNVWSEAWHDISSVHLLFEGFPQVVFLVLTSRYFSPKLLIRCVFCWLCLPVSKIICLPLGGIAEICENFLRATMMCFNSSGSSTTPTSHLSQITAGSSSGPYQRLIFLQRN